MLDKNAVTFLKEHFSFGVVGCFHRFDDNGNGTESCRICGKVRRRFSNGPAKMVHD